MSPERLSELREVLFNLNRKIAPLQWDLSRNQINEYKKLELQRLIEEKNNFQKEMDELEHSANP